MMIFGPTHSVLRHSTAVDDPKHGINALWSVTTSTPCPIRFVDDGGDLAFIARMVREEKITMSPGDSFAMDVIDGKIGAIAAAARPGFLCREDGAFLPPQRRKKPSPDRKGRRLQDSRSRAQH